MKDPVKEFGYPREGLVFVETGGGDGYEVPQECFSAPVCGWCRKFREKDWTCTKDGEDKDPDNDSCDDIDYIDERLEDLRDPVRSEYSSDKAFEKAKKAIAKMRKGR